MERQATRSLSGLCLRRAFLPRPRQDPVRYRSRLIPEVTVVVRSTLCAFFPEYTANKTKACRSWSEPLKTIGIIK
ncbi:hypothetical protein ABIE88_003410 [Bradyrhizobium diazoefficiens]